ncbi:MAG TPA: hypothetical protein VFX59_22080 [Polyangiales bacterium]|nr:hypothetical protein [Polyangiales bacterium]
MKSRSFGELLNALTVLIPGAVGAFVIARTLGTYWGHDSLASLIVGSIGAAFALGLLELLGRLWRAGGLEREIGALPATPSDATLDASSPLLSAMLRSRLEQAPQPGLGESSAPFLTGLLVMLGLLGTLLGLFQTVHGAGHALTNSTDVEALRRSLSTPIDGLTRSFGCSAAGISASAMLGLAIALVRRREGRVLRAFYAYASGPLRMLSPLRRQARALEQLASQGNLLPQTASAFESVGGKLSQLSAQLIAQQQSALEAQQHMFTELVGAVRSDMAKLSGVAGEALQSSASTLIDQLSARSREALTAQVDALGGAARTLTAELGRDASERRQEATLAMEALRSRLDEAERARAAAHGEELAKLTELASRTVTEAEQRERAVSARWDELVQRLDAQLASVRESEAARLSAIDAQAAQMRESERARLEALDAQLLAARDLEGERLARLDGLTTRAGGELERLSGALSAQLEARLQNERAQDERADKALAQLSAAAVALETGIARQEGALSQLVERLPPLFNEVAEAAQRSAQESFAQLVALTEQQLGKVSSLLADEVAQRADAARGHDERAFAALERAEQSAQLLDGAIQRQGHGLEALVERVGAILPGLADAAQAGAAQTLQRLSESAEQQALRFGELEAGLERSRSEHAQGLADQLAKHAADLEERLAKAGTSVQEAAAIWQASSVEMQAVAELFATSVERQREASDAWLESLGEVEGAVERAGRHAARDALSDQLASTQEVFARQLQFQRELFEQLRTLRSGSSTSTRSHGEHDAPV